MTTKEIAEAAGVSTDTVQRVIRSQYPEKMEHGKKTELTQIEAIEVMKAIRKINFVDLPQTSPVLPQTSPDISSAFAMMASAFLPMAMLYRDEKGLRDPQWMKFQRTWARPAIRAKEYVDNGF